MRLKIFAVLILSGFVHCASQQQNVDTLRIYPMPEVVITATRSEIQMKDSPVYVDIYHPDDIQKLNGSTVADLLKNSTGVFINELGGGASLKTASLRGTSSQNLLILVDGIRNNNMQNGLSFLNQEFLSNVEIIEIVHGGNSALYGADAVGGVVNIITKKPVLESDINVKSSIGSYGLFSYYLHYERTFKNFGFRVSYDMERSKDNYKFRTLNPPSGENELERLNADYLKRNWSVNLNIKPDNKSNLLVQTKFYQSDFGVPGSISYLTPYARQSDDDASVYFHYENKNFNNIIASLKTGFRYSYETYRDKNSHYPINSYYKNLYLYFNPQMTIKLAENIRTIASGEYSEGILYSNDFDSRIIRSQRALYLSNELEQSWDRNYFDRLFLFQTLRYDQTSDVEHSITPKIGFNFRIIKNGDLHIRGSAGNSFRVPTFNDLYYKNFGNPGLMPERSSYFDAGIGTEIKFLGIHRGSVTYFYYDITKRIIFDIEKFKPTNIGEVVSKGVELSYFYDIFDKLIEIEINHTFTSAKKMDRYGSKDSTYGKQLVNLPKNITNGRISLLLKPVRITFMQNFVGERYTSMDNYFSLSSYTVSNANITTKIMFMGIKFIVKLEVNNIFNKYYEIFEGYPIPGRTFCASIGLNY
mgnify:CR=1 FL=1